MVALGGGSGSKFDAPLALNQERKGAPPSHVVVGYDDRGRLHAVWIDHRDGRPNLYYAVVDRGRVVKEENLTAPFKLAVCPSSRPAIHPLRRGAADIYVRAVDENGMQGIFKIALGESGKATAPQRLGEALASQTCPPAGPVSAMGFTAWWDSASRKPGILATSGPGMTPFSMPAKDGSWSLLRSPRFVASDEAGVVALHLQGNGKGRIYLHEGRSWKLVMDDVPEWCTAVAWIEGQILMAGQINTLTRVEALVVRW
jgi:hypothetical protein